MFSDDANITGLYNNSDLLDYFDGEEFDEDEDYGRRSALATFLPDEADISFRNCGSHHGRMFITIVFEDSVWMKYDAFGSCEGCDYFLSHPEEWTKDALRGMYEFESLIDAITWILFKYHRETSPSKRDKCITKQAMIMAVEAFEEVEEMDIFEIVR